MSYLNEQDQLQMASLSGSKIILRRANPTPDTATEILNEIGTTDKAIGDATVEVMITTMGKIPNEMFNLEDTTPGTKLMDNETTILPFNTTHTIFTSTEGEKPNNSYTEHCTVLLILLIILLIILLLCCVTACLVARSKRKQNIFGRSDIECEPGCGGMSQPLLDKMSEANNKTNGGFIKK